MKLGSLSPYIVCSLIAAPLGAQGLGRTSLAIGPVFPYGDLAQVAGAGVAFNAVTSIPIGMTPFTFRLLAGYSRFRFSIPTGSSSTSIGHAQNPDYVEINAGVEIENPRAVGTAPYATIGLGYYYGEGSVPANINGGNHQNDHLGGSVGGGIKFRAGRRDLFLDARYVTISGGDRYLPVTLGMTF